MFAALTVRIEHESSGGVSKLLPAIAVRAPTPDPDMFAALYVRIE